MRGTPTAARTPGGSSPALRRTPAPSARIGDSASTSNVALRRRAFTVRRRSRAAPAGRRDVAPASAVAFPARRAAARPSTTSQPASFDPAAASAGDASASAVEREAADLRVPVSGANAGSRKSMSNETNTGRAPTLPSTARRSAAAPRSRARRWSAPRSSLQVARHLQVLAPYSEPRVPACTDAVVSSRPSSAARFERRAVKIRLAEVLLPRSPSESSCTSGGPWRLARTHAARRA